ncbi:hypothetical protein U1Q18_035003 [Sarracenia purpurea var. burkii]
MGNTSSMLTQYDIEEVQEHCNNSFSQHKIISLYQRFCQLDRNSGGFISANEILSVPEFAVNPLSQSYSRSMIRMATGRTRPWRSPNQTREPEKSFERNYGGVDSCGSSSCESRSTLLSQIGRFN